MATKAKQSQKALKLQASRKTKTARQLLLTMTLPIGWAVGSLGTGLFTAMLRAAFQLPLRELDSGHLKKTESMVTKL
jgi:hypothetical protein